jgi:hypothetical protein
LETPPRIALLMMRFRTSLPALRGSSAMRIALRSAS